MAPPPRSQPPSKATTTRSAILTADVVLYHAPECHLCSKARAVLEAELVDGFEEVDISGDPELEARYREWLPVVEIGGERAFVYFVDASALRRKLGRS